MEEGRTALRPDPVGGGIGHAERLDRVASVGVEILQPREFLESTGDPTRWRPYADPEAVVFANEKQRHPQTLVLALRRGVERTLRGGMVRRGVPETAHHD